MRLVMRLLLPAAFAALAPSALAQVTAQKLERAAADPGNWMMYSGTYDAQRYSRLTQINKANVKKLELEWVVQDQVPGVWQSNPLVVDGVMYLTQRPNDAMAIDPRTGKHFWIYRWTPRPASRSGMSRSATSNRPIPSPWRRWW